MHSGEFQFLKRTDGLSAPRQVRILLKSVCRFNSSSGQTAFQPSSLSPHTIEALVFQFLKRTDGLSAIEACIGNGGSSTTVALRKGGILPGIFLGKFPGA